LSYSIKNDFKYPIKEFKKYIRRGFLAKTQILNPVEIIPIKKINVPKYRIIPFAIKHF